MAKNIAESFNPLSRAHERYRRLCDSKDPNVTTLTIQVMQFSAVNLGISFCQNIFLLNWMIDERNR